MWTPRNPEQYLQHAAEFTAFQEPPLTLAHADASPEASLVNAFMALAVNDEFQTAKQENGDFQEDALRFDTLQQISTTVRNIFHAYTNPLFMEGPQQPGYIQVTQAHGDRRVVGAMNEHFVPSWGGSFIYHDERDTNQRRPSTFYKVTLENASVSSPIYYQLVYESVHNGNNPDSSLRRFEALVAFIPRIKTAAIWIGYVDSDSNAQDPKVSYFDEGGRRLLDEEVAALPSAYQFKRSGSALVFAS